ncbi:MAG: hypothetical protein JXQ90_06555 [Cyclobacteriaceae bacterium]
MRFWICCTLMVGVLSGCKNEFTASDMEGLWTLESVNVDGYVKPVPDILLNFQSNNRLAIAQRSGDHLGFFGINDDYIKFQTDADGWFNTDWKIQYFGDHIDLKGRYMPFTVTRLRFRRTNHIPDFEEFANDMIGEWKMYKIRTSTSIEQVSNMRFIITSSDEYFIYNKSEIIENGRAIINPRHRKISFENDDTLWNAWFYGDELRLENKARDIQYSLRR